MKNREFGIFSAAAIPMGDALSALPGATSDASTTTGATATPSWISTLKDPVIKADMTAASAGGTVAEIGMAQLFSDLAAELTTNKTTLSASQFNDLKTIAADLNVGETASSYVTYITDQLIDGNPANAKWTDGTASATTLGNLAVGATATQINELNGKWFLGTDLPSSTVQIWNFNTQPFTSTTYSVTYSAVTYPAFGTSGPSMSDINQEGSPLGDCYLLASLAEVANQDPSIIQSMITNNGNNTYGVRFFVNGTAEYVTVNNALADGGTEFNRALNNDIWASLVEKAYAQIQASGVITDNPIEDGISLNYGDSFSAIGNGGVQEYALEEITDASAITDFDASGSSWTKDVFNDALVGQSATSGLTTASVLTTLAIDVDEGSDAVLLSCKGATDPSNPNKDTLIADHSMSIYGYDCTDGEFEIRNPWGVGTGQFAGSNQYWDTTFEVSLSTLLADGDTITVDNLTPSAASVVTGALVSAGPGLQANAAVKLFTISDTAANVSAAFSSLSNDSKLISITLTDTNKPTLTLTAAQYSADTAVLVKVVSSYNLTVTGALVSGAAALQSNAQVTSFTISDSSANVASNIAALNGDTKLSSISLTDSNPLSITYAQSTGDATALGKLPSTYKLSVSGVTASNAATVQANTHVTSFTISDSSADVTSYIDALNGDTKLSSIGLTDANSLSITYAQLTGDTTALGKLPSTYKLSVSGVAAANAATVQANTHVTSFLVSDTVADVTAKLSSLNGDSKLSAMAITGTTSGDTLNLAGSKIPATINMEGDTASVSAGLSAPSLTFSGTPDAITLGTGATSIDYTLASSGGIETIANFQYGLDVLDINLNGAANSVLHAANTKVNGQNAISIYSSAAPTHGVVLLNVGSSMTAANLVASHLTFGNGNAFIC
jgi:hypothetical protein